MRKFTYQWEDANDECVELECLLDYEKASRGRFRDGAQIEPDMPEEAILLTAYDKHLVDRYEDLSAADIARIEEQFLESLDED